MAAVPGGRASEGTSEFPSMLAFPGATRFTDTRLTTLRAVSFGEGLYSCEAKSSVEPVAIIAAI